VKRLAIFLLVLALPVLVQAAETRYVTDHLIITLRSGQGSQYQIIKTLPSGTPLEVLETTDSGYSRVRTPDGAEGWVLTRYLSEEPIARDRLAKVQKQLERLQTRHRKLRTQLAELRKQTAELQAERDRLRSENAKLTSELKHLREVAAKPIELEAQNRTLKQQNVSLEKELQLVRQENQVLQNSSQRDWFIAGAGVLLGGILLGLILPRIRWRRKNTW